MSDPLKPTGKVMQIDVPIVGEYKQDILQTGDGLRWVHGKGSQDILAIYHEMEPAGHSIHDYICGHFRPGLVFLDIGAHVGHYAIRAAHAGCTVYAVEANPESAAQLRMNMRVNNMTDMTVWNVAAWDTFDVLPITAEAEFLNFRNGGNSVMPLMDGRTLAGITVAGVPLDVLLDDVECLDLVKIDVEGADVRVLDGMMRSLRRLRPKLIIEDHSIYGYFQPEQLTERERDLTVTAGYTWRPALDEGVQGQINYRIGVPGD